MERSMIAHVRGTLAALEPACVVNVGGFGVEVQVTEKDRAALADVSGEVSFHTYLHVREDSLTLFGFLAPADRTLFLRLIDVSGIGPKMAVRILGAHATPRLVEALKSGDHAFLSSLPGLGRKTAERLIVELKDKLADFEVAAGAPDKDAATDLREEAVLALTTLGMPRGAAEKALEHIDWKSQDAKSLSNVVKQALRHAAGAR
jgi:Holliday junction DNA helicase RuvA